jgi:hypothetical protein
MSDPLAAFMRSKTPVEAPAASPSSFLLAHRTKEQHKYIIKNVKNVSSENKTSQVLDPSMKMELKDSHQHTMVWRTY